MSKMQTLTPIAALLAFSITGVAHAAEAPASAMTAKHTTALTEAKCGAHKAKSGTEAKCGASMKMNATAKPVNGASTK